MDDKQNPIQVSKHSATKNIQRSQFDQKQKMREVLIHRFPLDLP